MRPLDTYKKRHFRCENNHLLTDLRWGKDPSPICADCSKEMYETIGPGNLSAYVIGDECDVVIRHGACWPDGTPRHFNSKAEIKRVAYEAGWTQWGNTPKPNPRLEERLAKERESR